MIKSRVTQKIYDPSACVYISNVLQVKKMLDYLGPEYLLDVLWSSEHRPDALVFVWKKCAETAEAKRLWDQHIL
jgi:hypothetical protein